MNIGCCIATKDIPLAKEFGYDYVELSAKEIMKMNKDNGKSLIRHGGYEYYEDNPALTMHEAVEKILVECGLY